MTNRISKAVGKWWCAIVRDRGGKHKFVDGHCVRCGRKQPVKKVSTVTGHGDNRR